VSTIMPGVLHHLLDLDPDLGEHLPARRFGIARAEILSPVLEWPRGEAPVGTGVDEPDSTLGLLIVSGLITRRVTVVGRRCVELLGPGDVFRPWQADDGHMVAPLAASLQVLEPARLAVIDRATTLRLAFWPEVLSVLVGRLIGRSRALAGNLALTQVPRVEDRVLVALWHLADRFGRVTPEGVVLPLALSHELVGALVGAQRQTVTTAAGRLAERGLVRRRADHGWLLIGGPPELADHAA
jgi:CRP/FNR family transcriptional regulator, cyclic AMP receptor protein